MIYFFLLALTMNPSLSPSANANEMISQRPLLRGNATTAGRLRLRSHKPNMRLPERSLPFIVRSAHNFIDRPAVERLIRAQTLLGNNQLRDSSGHGVLRQQQRLGEMFEAASSNGNLEAASTDSVWRPEEIAGVSEQEKVDKVKRYLGAAGISFQDVRFQWDIPSDGPKDGPNVISVVIPGGSESEKTARTIISALRKARRDSLFRWLPGTIEVRVNTGDTFRDNIPYSGVAVDETMARYVLKQFTGDVPAYSPDVLGLMREHIFKHYKASVHDVITMRQGHWTLYRRNTAPGDSVDPQDYYAVKHVPNFGRSQVTWNLVVGGKARQAYLPKMNRFVVEPFVQFCESLGVRYSWYRSPSTKLGHKFVLRALLAPHEVDELLSIAIALRGELELRRTVPEAKGTVSISRYTDDSVILQ